MPNLKHCAPASADLAIPMPDRGGQIMPIDGRTVDLSKQYYRRLLDDGDIVEVKKTRPAPAKGGARKRQ